jgi:HD-GYP domain-containing protein (c-di-GMP phosphodiesterase class II)
METANPATTPEQLFARGRNRALNAACGRERVVEQAAAGGFLLVAAGMAVFMDSPRALEMAPLISLVVAYVLACQARFDIADGYTVPTELVLVPMLFLLPTPAVPLVVSLSWALGRLIAGAQTFAWSSWPVYLLALLAQFGFDFAATATRARLIDGTRSAAVLRMIAPVYGLDAALAPIGLLAAVAALQLGPGICLAVIPLALVLAVLSRERQTRLDQALALSEAYQGTALLLGDVVEADDAYTGSHSRGVVELSLAVSDRLGLGFEQRRNVEFAALLHDVGKIAVPNEIINKEGPLDEAEWEVMRQHTIEGERMLKRIGGVLAEVGKIVRASHEDFDGSGYPDGLAGEEIPIEARIVTCCDAFSAMTTTRSYRKAMGTEAAIAELHRCAGTQFDPRVVSTLVGLVESGEV